MGQAAVDRRTFRVMSGREPLFGVAGTRSDVRLDDAIATVERRLAPHLAEAASLLLVNRHGLDVRIPGERSAVERAIESIVLCVWAGAPGRRLRLAGAAGTAAVRLWLLGTDAGPDVERTEDPSLDGYPVTEDLVVLARTFVETLGGKLVFRMHRGVVSELSISLPRAAEGR